MNGIQYLLNIPTKKIRNINTLNVTNGSVKNNKANIIINNNISLNKVMTFKSTWVVLCISKVMLLSKSAGFFCK